MEMKMNPNVEHLLATFLDLKSERPTYFKDIPDALENVGALIATLAAKNHAGELPFVEATLAAAALIAIAEAIDNETG